MRTYENDNWLGCCNPQINIIKLIRYINLVNKVYPSINIDFYETSIFNAEKDLDYWTKELERRPYP